MIKRWAVPCPDRHAARSQSTAGALVGHSGTSVTELGYRKQIRPVVEDGAMAMDRLFPHRKPREQPE